MRSLQPTQITSQSKVFKGQHIRHFSFTVSFQNINRKGSVILFTEPKRKRVLISISAVAVAVVVIVASLYALQPRQPQITVKEGSNSYTLMGDFFNDTDGVKPPYSFNNYSATTIFTETGPDQNYGLNFTETGSENYSLNSSMSGTAFSLFENAYYFVFVLYLYLRGNLPYNLHPSGLVISVEPVPGSTPAFRSYFKNTVSLTDYGLALGTPMPVNASVASTAPGFSGSSNLSLSLLNDTGLRSNQTFYFSLVDAILSMGGPPVALHYNTTYGLSVTASFEGLSKPVSVTLYLFFIGVPET